MYGCPASKMATAVCVTLFVSSRRPRRLHLFEFHLKLGHGSGLGDPLRHTFEIRICAVPHSSVWPRTYDRMSSGAAPKLTSNSSREPRGPVVMKPGLRGRLSVGWAGGRMGS